MKIALIGYGRMGKEIEKLAVASGVEVAVIIDPQSENAMYREISARALSGIDVAIDFTIPEAVVDNVGRIAACKVNLIVGTTGWYDQEDKVREMVEQSGIGFLYSSNFSLGVAAFFQMVEHAAKRFDRLDMYDIFGYELHHNQKKDSPSGTAKSVEKILIQNIKRKTSVVEEKLDRKIEPNELHFASVRSGSIPGTHVVGFDSAADTIEIKHTARSRQGFASGALAAARWLDGKSGFFTMDDFVKDFLG